MVESPSFHLNEKKDGKNHTAAAQRTQERRLLFGERHTSGGFDLVNPGSVVT
jgi:hypothetical protein